jgi:hypothetical protein
MKTKESAGLFNVIDSFLIRRRNEFYLIGSLEKGEVKEQWFINIPLNKSLSVTVRIKQIEDVEMANSGGKYKLLIIHNDPELEDFLLALNIGSEFLDISIEGED